MHRRYRHEEHRSRRKTSAECHKFAVPVPTPGEAGAVVDAEADDDHIGIAMWMLPAIVFGKGDAVKSIGTPVHLTTTEARQFAGDAGTETFLVILDTDAADRRFAEDEQANFRR